MDDHPKTCAPSEPTPWGLLPPRMRVLFVTTPEYTGEWLVEAFATDSASQVFVQQAVGMITAMAQLRTEPYDAVLLVHQPSELDAFAMVEQLKAGCSRRQPIVILGTQPVVECEELCLELDVSYACLKTTTTRALMWQIARATERHLLLTENDRLRQAERRRREVSGKEAGWFIQQQLSLATEIGSEEDNRWKPPANVVDHYREILQTYIIMGSGNLVEELRDLNQVLLSANMSARQFMAIHLAALEDVVQDLGKRSTRHILNRADLLAIGVLFNLCDGYRFQASSAVRAA